MHQLNTADEELMAQYQLGSEEAFAVLYERHSSKVYGYISSRIRDRERATDAFQEVFAKMHKSKHLYNRSLPFLPWLFSISRSVTLDAIRSEVRRETEVLGFDEKDFTIETPEKPAHEISELRPKLAKLPDAQRLALEMRYVDEKTFEEIAAVLSTSPMNVRKLVSRGVRRLKELIQEGDKP